MSDALDYANDVLLDNQKKGGMTIKYIQSSDNKYVQYRLMATLFTTDENDWQGIDDEPTADSENLVKSGGIQAEFKKVNLELYGDNLQIKVSFDFSSYTTVLFDKIIPAGTTIQSITNTDNAFGYFQKTDGNFNVDEKTNTSTPFVTSYDYQGLTATGKGTITITLAGEPYVGLTERVDNLEIKDDTPILNSSNIVKSGGVYFVADSICKKFSKNIYDISSLLESTLNNAYLDSGLRIYDTTLNYTLYLYRLPKGIYNIKVIETALQNMQFNEVFESVDDFSMGGHGTRFLVPNALGDYSVFLEKETLIGFMGFPNISKYVTIYEYTNVDEQIEELSIIVDNIENRVDDIENKIESSERNVLEDISDTNTYYADAYIDSSQQKLYSQDAGLGRNVRGYQVNKGDMIYVTGIIPNSPTYGFLAFLEGTDTPSFGNSVICLVNQTNQNYNPVEYTYTVPSDGWILLGFNSASFQKRYSNYDWRIYRYVRQVLDLPKTTLPNKMTAVVGDTLQVFIRSCTNAIDIRQYDTFIRTTRGTQYPRYWQFTPNQSDIGEFTMYEYIRNLQGQILSTKSCRVTVKGTLISPSSMKRIMVLGDSLTAPGAWTNELARRLLSSDAGSSTMPAGSHLSSIKLIGSMGSGDAKYFGVGGWFWDTYASGNLTAFRFQVEGVTNIVKDAVYTNNGHRYTVLENNTTDGVGNILCAVNSATDVPEESGTLTKVSGSGDATVTFTSAASDAQNPLWDSINQKISYTHYLNDISEPDVDAVVFQLGWNGTANKFEDYEGYIELLLDTLHTEYPNAVVKIMGVQMPSLNGGLGANYGAWHGMSNLYNMIQFVVSYNSKIQELCESQEYSSFVEYVDVASQFDSENNMPESEVQVNTRSTKTEYRGSNGVHPATSGFYQIADVMWRNIVKTFC